MSPGAHWGIDVIGYPLLVGLGFGGLLLAILWGGRWLRSPFEFAPMRIIGLFSYSLYLWHLPIIHGDVPLFAGAPLVIALGEAFMVAYLSYQFVERPFLKRRHHIEGTPVEAVTVPVLSPVDEPDADFKSAERVPTLV